MTGREAAVAVSELAVHAAMESGADTTAEELASLTLLLRAELADFPVHSVHLVTDASVPAGAKGAGVAGGLLIRLVAQRDLLLGVIGGIRSWLQRQRLRSVKLTIDGDELEVTGVSSAQQDRLIELWVARHASPD
jgi:hypothetical protein